jgi:hypothetical protein
VQKIVNVGRFFFFQSAINKITFVFILFSFAHGQEELRWTEDLYKTLPCPYYKKDDMTSCLLGNTCRWAHGEEELRARTDNNGHIVSRDHEKKKKSKVRTSSKDFLNTSKTNMISCIDQEKRKCCDYDSDLNYFGSNVKSGKKQSDSVEHKKNMSPCNALNQGITHEKKMNLKVAFKSPKHTNVSNSVKKKSNCSTNQIRKTANRFNQYTNGINILNSPIQEKRIRSTRTEYNNTNPYCDNGSISLKEKYHSLYKTFNESVQSVCPHLSYGSQKRSGFSQQPKVFIKEKRHLEEMTTNGTTTDRSNNSHVSKTLSDFNKTPQGTKEDDLDFTFSLNHQSDNLLPYYMYRSSSLTTLQDHLSMQGVLESPCVLTIPSYQRFSTQSSMPFYDHTKDSESLKSYDDINAPYNSLHGLYYQSKNYHGRFSHNRNAFRKTTFIHTDSPRRVLITSRSDLPLCQHDLKGNKILSDLYSNSWTCDVNHCAVSQEFGCSLSTASVSCHLCKEKFAQEEYTSPPYEPFYRANFHGMINSRSDSFINPLLSDKKYDKVSQHFDTSDLHSFYCT